MLVGLYKSHQHIQISSNNHHSGDDKEVLYLALQVQGDLNEIIPLQ